MSEFQLLDSMIEPWIVFVISKTSMKKQLFNDMLQRSILIWQLRKQFPLWFLGGYLFQNSKLSSVSRVTKQGLDIWILKKAHFHKGELIFKLLRTTNSTAVLEVTMNSLINWNSKHFYLIFFSFPNTVIRFSLAVLSSWLLLNFWNYILKQNKVKHPNCCCADQFRSEFLVYNSCILISYRQIKMLVLELLL